MPIPISALLEMLGMGSAKQGQNPLPSGQMPFNTAYNPNMQQATYGQRANPDLYVPSPRMTDAMIGGPFDDNRTRAKTPQEAAQSMRKVDADDMRRQGQLSQLKYKR